MNLFWIKEILKKLQKSNYVLKTVIDNSLVDRLSNIRSINGRWEDPNHQIISGEGGNGWEDPNHPIMR